MTTAVLVVAWLGLALVPVGWWVWTRRRVDVWKHLPVPAVLVDAAGTVRSRTGPAGEVDLTLSAGLPATGRIVRTKTANGTPLAVSGVRGGALAVALPADPVRDQRDHILADLGSRLAHDLNTPVSALLGHLDLLDHEPLSDQARSSVATMQRELARLQKTAQDLLAFTRLRLGGGERTAQLAGALAEEAVAGVIDEADALGAQLSVETPNERVLVTVAEADLVRALRNLTVNALRHGLGERRQVVVSVDATAEVVTFSVTDSGPGVSADRLAALSEPFVRGNGSPGAGLGLAIVAEVLSAHGSRLDSTNAPGGGASLSFALPRLPG